MSEHHRVDAMYSPAGEEPYRLLPERLAYIEQHILPFPLGVLLPEHTTRVPTPVLPPLGNLGIDRGSTARTGDVPWPRAFGVVVPLWRWRAVRRRRREREGGREWLGVG